MFRSFTATSLKTVLTAAVVAGAVGALPMVMATQAAAQPAAETPAGQNLQAALRTAFLAGVGDSDLSTLSADLADLIQVAMVTEGLSADEAMAALLGSVSEADSFLANDILGSVAATVVNRMPDQAESLMTSFYSQAPTTVHASFEGNVANVTLASQVKTTVTPPAAVDPAANNPPAIVPVVPEPGTTDPVAPPSNG